MGFRNFEHQAAELKEKFALRPDTIRLKKGVYLNRHARNNYLKAFAPTCVLGGLAFLGFFYSWLLECCNSGSHREFFTPIVAAFLVSGMFENTFYDSEVLNVVLVFYLCSQVVMTEEVKQVARIS